MLDTLRLVRGAVADKDLVPVLTHFHIYNGRIQGGNGRVTIDAPLPELKDMQLTVPADRFLKAVDGCQGEPQLTETDAGALMVKLGSFRVRLPLAAKDEFPKQGLPGLSFTPALTLLPILKRLRPFIGEDASRPHLCSILIAGGYAYATNNPVLIRVPAPDLPDMTIPVFAADELLRIGRNAQAVAQKDGALYFDLGDDVWLSCQLLEGEWPDVGAFFEDREQPPAIPDGMAGAVSRVLPFCPDAKFPEILLGPAGVSTADGDMSATVEGIELTESRWHAKNLQLILSEATAMDFSTWPAPCYWVGDGGAQGIAVGLTA